MKQISRHFFALAIAVAGATFVSHSAQARVRYTDIQCDSQDYRYQHCDVGRRVVDVQLVRQLSTGRGQCLNYQRDGNVFRSTTYDMDRRGIWVDSGCRGIFRVAYQDFGGGGGGGYPPPPPPPPPPTHRPVVDVLPFIDGNWQSVMAAEGLYDVTLYFACDGNHSYEKSLQFNGSPYGSTVQVTGERGDACGHNIEVSTSGRTLMIRNAINYRIQIRVLGYPR